MELQPRGPPPSAPYDHYPGDNDAPPAYPGYAPGTVNYGYVPHQQHFPGHVIPHQPQPGHVSPQPVEVTTHVTQPAVTKPHPAYVAPRRRTNCILVCTCLFCIASLVLLCVAIATPYWLTMSKKVPLISHTVEANYGLFKSCVVDVCLDTQIIHDIAGDLSGESVIPIVLLAARAILFSALGLSALSLLLICFALCHKGGKCCAVTSGILLVLAALAIAAVGTAFYLGVYAFKSPDEDDGILDKIGKKILRYTMRIGYSFYMCAVSAGLTFLTSILAYVGACSEQRPGPGIVVT